MLFSKITVCAQINQACVLVLTKSFITVYFVRYYYTLFWALSVVPMLKNYGFIAKPYLCCFTVWSTKKKIQEISETIFYSLENCLLQLICTMYGIPEGTSSATFSKTVGNTCFMFYTISSVMLFVSVSPVCTLMFLVLKWMLASHFVECYVWSCVMFDERFTLCFKVVGELSNVEIYVLVFFAYVDPRAWSLFRLRRCPKFCVFSWLPHRWSVSAMLMWLNVTVMRKYAFPVGTKNIFIQVKTGDPGFT